EIREYLALQGWPDPAVANSGNGCHLIYRIDLPNDDESRILVGNVLHALDEMFSDDAINIDTTMGNAARINKLYGTLAAKGEDMPDRPHRWSGITEAPETLQVVPTHL